MTKLFGSQLTQEQLVERRKGIGASEASMILAGGESWITLWKSKTGRGDVPFKMSEWDKALRHTSEGLSADWYGYKTDCEVIRRGEAVIYSEWPVIRCTLDGFIEPNTVFEAKHISPHTPGDPIKWAIEKYQVQTSHQMIACGVSEAILSVIVGMAEPICHRFFLDPFWQDDYIARCKEFWWYVENNIPPPGAEEMDAPPIPHEEMREVDFTGNNEWSNFAADWLENKKAAGVFKKAEAGLKELVEKDVKKATGHGIVISRSKANALSIKEVK